MNDEAITSPRSLNTLHPPSPIYSPRRTSSPRRPSHDSQSHRDGSSVYEEAAEAAFVSLKDTLYDTSGGMDIDSGAYEATSFRPESPLPARLSESSNDRIRNREWWFGVKEAMRGHLQHLSVQSDTDALPRHTGQPSFPGGIGASAAYADATARSKSVARQQVADGPYAGTNADELSAFHQISTGYHAHLLKIVRNHPEALTLVHYALRCLGGRWSIERRACVRDEVFHISIRPEGATKRTQLDCTDETQFRTFRNLLSTPREEDDETVSVLVLPDLSPLVIEQVGGLLKIDHRVFSNHIWSTRRRPFSVPNRHGFDARANTAEPDGCTMAEVDTYADMYVSGGGSLQRTEKEGAKARWLWQFRTPPQAYHFLDRQFDKWPDAISPPSDVRHELSTTFYASSRATVHCIRDPRSPVQVLVLLTPSSSWAPECGSMYSLTTMGATVYCRDEGDPFLQQDAPSMSAGGPTAPSEPERYCGELERYFATMQPSPNSSVPTFICIELRALQWLVDKFVTAASQLLDADARRLAFFRYPRDPQRRVPEAGGNGLLRDMQQLRDKATKCTKVASALELKLLNLLDLSSSLSVASPELPSLTPPSSPHSSLRALQGLQTRLASHIGAIAATQSDISASLAHTLTLLQLEESRKSIAQNESVRRLTMLAFFFVPVSATTSAFGMNVAELLSNPPPAWSFVVCALGVSTLMLAFATADWFANVLAGLNSFVSPVTDDRKKALGLENPRTMPRAVRGTLRVLVGGTMDVLRVALFPLRFLATAVSRLHDEGTAVRAGNKVAHERRVQRKLGVT